MNEIAYSEKIIDLYGNEKHLDICLGDVAEIEGDPVVFLVFSAFPNDYSPTPGSLVGRLYASGIDVAGAALGREKNCGENWYCWLSQEVRNKVGSKTRLVCFEQENGINPASVVGNVFRTIREFLMKESGRRARIVRLPLLSTGDQGFEKTEMMTAILRQAYLHLLSVANMERVQLFLRKGAKDLSRLLIYAGSELERCRVECISRNVETKFDFFISYRQVDAPLKDELVDSIRRYHPSVRVFVDREQLKAGSYWKAELLHAMASSRRAICLATDSYSLSPECMDEFHMAVNFNNKSGDFLIPLLSLRTASISDLPVSMTRIHWDNVGVPPTFPKLSLS